MKICVFGNSHAGMLNQAYCKDRPENLHLTFFAQQGQGPINVGLRGSEIFAAKRELRRSLRRLGMPLQVDLRDYDAIVMVAMTATIFSVLPFVTGHSVYGWPSSQEEIEKVKHSDAEPLERPFISEAAVRHAIKGEIKANLAHRLVEMVRNVCDVPIFLVPQPFPSADVLEDKNRHIGLRRMRWRKDGRDAVVCLRQAHNEVFSGWDGVRILAQPRGTVAHDFLTRPEYARGGARLNTSGTQPETDILHANVKYGQMVLEQIKTAAQALETGPELSENLN